MRQFIYGGLYLENPYQFKNTTVKNDNAVNISLIFQILIFIQLKHVFMFSSSDEYLCKIVIFNTILTSFIPPVPPILISQQSTSTHEDNHMELDLAENVYFAKLSEGGSQS